MIIIITPRPLPTNTLDSDTIRIIDDRVVRTPFSVGEVGRYKPEPPYLAFARGEDLILNQR